MPTDLHLAPRLRLDPDYIAGGTFALLAKKGWGKTYAMRVLAEEFARTDVPFVCLDPMDAFWGLRAGSDGASKGGLSIPIFGGPHGDVPLEPTAGKLMADLVVREGLSMVLSIAHFGSRAAERRFAKDFLDQLYRTNTDLVHLLVDEADLFAPQKPQAGDQPLLGVTENIVRRGRNKGIGITMGTQRPAVLNKDVLTQVDGLIIGRMLGPNDRNAIDGWVGEHDVEGKVRNVKAELPELKTGQAIIWIPEQGVWEKAQIRKARTFDSSPTRKRTTRRDKRLTLTDVDLSTIAGQIAETIEQAKAEDPAELRKQIADLERQLRERPEAAAEPIEVKVPIFSDDSLVPDDLRKMTTDITNMAMATKDFAERMGRQVDRAEALVEGQAPRAAAPAPGRRPSPPPPAAAPSGPRSQDNGALPKAEHRILNVLAQFPEGRSKVQIAILTGYSAKSGGFNNALGKLRSRGYISPAGVEPIQATAEGLAAVPDVLPLPQGEELLAHWMAKLGKAEREILRALYDAHPRPLTKEEIGEATGYSTTSGGFNNALGKLRSLELAIGYGEIRASDALF